MKISRKFLILFSIGGIAGIIVQITGLVLIFNTAKWEPGVINGILLFLAGTIILMAVLEYSALKKDLNPAWALTAFSGPAGPVILLLLKSKKTEEENSECVEGTQKQSRYDRFAGIGLSVLVSIGFIWAVSGWFSIDKLPSASGSSDINSNEKKAFKRIKLIAEVQEEYKKTDWDRDGKNTYALFIVHLWRSVDIKGVPVHVDLISKELAFAMEDTRALDGYYYVDLHTRKTASGKYEELDPEQEWAIAAVPASYGGTGILGFIAESSGRIFAKDAYDLYVIDFHDDLGSHGWTQIKKGDDIEHLRTSINRH